MSFRVLVNTSMNDLLFMSLIFFFNMTLYKLIRNIAVDSNHLINMNKISKWHLIYILDHSDHLSTASLVSVILNL